MRKNKSNFNQKKGNRKMFVTIISAALIAVLACVGIGAMTSGFTNFSVIERNTDNLIAADTFGEDLIKDDSGVNVKANEDGVLSLTGSNKGASLAVIELGTIKLEAGEYTFTTGKNGMNDDTNGSTYYMGLHDGSTTVRADTKNTITVDAESEYRIVLCVNADENVDGVKLYPMILEGKDEATFYVTPKADIQLSK